MTHCAVAVQRCSYRLVMEFHMPPAAVATKKNVSAKSVPAANGKGPAKAAKGAPATDDAEEKAPRVKLADLPQDEKDAKAQELITELYGQDHEGDEGQQNKRKLRSRLRTLDKDWLNTYADFINENWPPAAAAEEEQEPAKPVAKAAKKASKKA